MTADVERFARERREADQRYNDALTALDRLVVAVSSRPAPDHDDLQKISTALVVFLQQITAFVETKDRQSAAEVAARFETIAPALDAIIELRAQVTILQRATDALRRQLEHAAPSTEQPAPGTPHGTRLGASSTRHSSTSDDYKYVGFEDQFRGSDADVRARLESYLPLFAGTTDVLDIGCGRGEFLAALASAGVRARGIDANGEMAAAVRERGLDAVQADALSYVASLADESLGGVIATQVVEHLEPPYLIRLLETVSHKLRSGAPLVIETINPACWLAFFSSYLRDFTHVRAVHPDTLQYLLRASGFERVDIVYSAPVPDHLKMKAVDLPSDVVASRDPVAVALARVSHALNANAAILNNLMFTHLDYAAIGYRNQWPVPAPKHY